MALVVEYQGDVGVPDFPENGEGYRGPNVVVEAIRQADVPYLVDEDGSRGPQVLPNLSSVRAKDKHVERVFTVRIASWAGAVRRKVLVEKIGLGIKSISENKTIREF